jgi:hypothetical protein
MEQQNQNNMDASMSSLKIEMKERLDTFKTFSHVIENIEVDKERYKLEFSEQVKSEVKVVSPQFGGEQASTSWKAIHERVQNGYKPL